MDIVIKWAQVSLLGNILYLDMRAGYIGMFILWKFTEIHTYTLCTLNINIFSI